MKNNRLARVLVSAVLCIAFLAIPAGSAQAMPFKTADNYAVGTNPIFIAVGDFNLDGKLDLVTANFNSSNVSILLNDGDDTFSPAAGSPITVGGNPCSVAVGDFDLDGIPDLAVANNDGLGNVYILLGDGDGTFLAAEESPVATFEGPQCVVVGDFNRDGIPDLATANYWSNAVYILIGHGDGTYGAPGNCAVGSGPQKAAVGDFDRDGIPDLAVANGGDSTVSILLGNGTGTFSEAVVSLGIGLRPLSVSVGDFNMDGIPDLATANANGNNVSVLIGTGTGAFAAAVNYPVGERPHIVSVGDFNMDGVLDLATANEDTSDVSILLNDGDGTFGTKTDYAAGTDPYCAAVGDFNLDGAPDLAVANYGSSNVSILLNTPPPTDFFFKAPANYTLGFTGNRGAVGDFNRDGWADLAVGNSAGNNIAILLGTGSGTFGTKQDYTTGSGARGIAMGDFNRDGIPDLVTANIYGNSVSILIGTGTGTFPGKTDYQAGNNPVYVAVGDFNRDGWADLAVASGDAYGSAVCVLIADGLGGFNAPVFYSTPVSTWYIAVGDFNRDGWDDLAVANWSTNIAILLNDGDGTFTAATSPAVGQGQMGVAVGDFNRDGKPDLAVSNLGSDNVSIFLGIGNGTFGDKTDYIAVAPYVIAKGDFNLDGRPDLAGANYGSRYSSILLGNGTGGFAIAIPVDGGDGNGTWDVAAGDFNRDGRPDLVMLNSGFVSVLLNTAPPTITSFLPTAGLAGTTVVITGSYFTGATAVAFGGTAADGFLVNNANQITATTGTGSTGKITVTTPDGTATSTGDFTFLTPPSVTTGSATSIMATTAILHGNLDSDGGEATTVVIYSGKSDGATGTWDRSDNLSVAAAGPFSLGVIGLTAGTPYFYRCYAENSAGGDWASSSTPFTTQDNLGLWKNYWEGPGKDWFWFSSGRP